MKLYIEHSSLIFAAKLMYDIKWTDDEMIKWSSNGDIQFISLHILGAFPLILSTTYPFIKKIQGFFRHKLIMINLTLLMTPSRSLELVCNISNPENSKTDAAINRSHYSVISMTTQSECIIEYKKAKND